MLVFQTSSVGGCMWQTSLSPGPAFRNVPRAAVVARTSNSSSERSSAYLASARAKPSSTTSCAAPSSLVTPWGRGARMAFETPSAPAMIGYDSRSCKSLGKWPPSLEPALRETPKGASQTASGSRERPSPGSDDAPGSCTCDASSTRSVSSRPVAVAVERLVILRSTRKPSAVRR
jgi:hypothetical protein